MAHYYINLNPQPTGEHEVHLESCSWLPNVENRVYLGTHLSCVQAVGAARARWPQNIIDVCYYCSNACHTR